MHQRMTWEEALGVLGIASDVDFKTARRAYLQRIKVHKPEQDPAGFQRVREAFELISPVLQARERGSAAVVVQASSAALPSDAPAPSATGSTIPQQDSEPQQPAPPQHIALPGPEDAERHFERAIQLLRQEDSNGAAPEFLQALELAARFPADVSLPGDLLLRVVADLAAQGQFIRARQLTDAVRSWVHALPSARQAFSAEGLPRWVLLEELVRSENVVSAPMYQALAKAITLNGEDATKDLELRQILNPNQSRQDLHALIKSAPTLAKTFGTLIDPPSAPSNKPRGRSWGWSWVVVIVLANMVRHCGSLFSEEHQARREVTPPPRSAPARVELPPIKAGDVDGAKIEEVGHDLANALSAAGDRYRTDDAVEALLYGECEQAGTALADLAPHARPLAIEARAGLQVLWAEFEVKCPGQMKKYEP